MNLPPWRRFHTILTTHQTRPEAVIDEQWVGLHLDQEFLVIHISFPLFKSKPHVDTPQMYFEFLFPIWSHCINHISLLFTSFVYWEQTTLGAPDLLRRALFPELYMETNVQTSNLTHFRLKLQLVTR